jgi:hypothetical protein
MPEFQECGSCYRLHDNAPVHSSGVLSEFLAKLGIPILSHVHYSPDLVLADLFLFPKLKITMKRMRFKAVSLIQ